jgi:hypothetical protein
MPINMSLVFIKRHKQANILPGQLSYKPQPVEAPKSTGISLRNIMNAPKTGCKSCGG